MSEGQRLFNVGKVGCFLDGYGPSVEKRSGEETPVIVIRFRVQPFDAALASALDAGVGGDSNIRATVFSLHTGDPKPNFTRHDFKLGLDRQNLELFSTPDTEVARAVLMQARITGTFVREQKDMNALAFCFKAAIGPVWRTELELIHSLYRMQTFITFHPAEPLLDYIDDGEDDLRDADEKAQRPAPMFDDDGTELHAEEPPTVREVGSRHKLHSHQDKKKNARRRKPAPVEAEG